MNELDPLIHAPKRLRIMAILMAAEQVDVTYLRERLGLSPPDLSKQMKALLDAGYVRGRRSGRGPGSTTWYRMSRTGRKAYEAYLDTLREVLDGPIAATSPGVALPAPAASSTPLAPPTPTPPAVSVSDPEVATRELDQSGNRDEHRQR